MQKKIDEVHVAPLKTFIMRADTSFMHVVPFNYLEAVVNGGSTHLGHPFLLIVYACTYNLVVCKTLVDMSLANII